MLSLRASVPALRNSEDLIFKREEWVTFAGPWTSEGCRFSRLMG